MDYRFNSKKGGIIMTSLRALVQTTEIPCVCVCVCLCEIFGLQYQRKSPGQLDSIEKYFQGLPSNLKVTSKIEFLVVELFGLFLWSFCRLN